MTENEHADVTKLFSAINAEVDTPETEQKSTATNAKSKYSLANSIISNASERDFGPEEPFTAPDMMTYFKSIGLKTTDICSFLTITNNRWGSMTKTCPSGRDMSYEYISPTAEILIRLLMAYPEHAPWKKITIKDVSDATGFDIVTLANITGSSVTAGGRWQEDSGKTTPLVHVLLKQIYKMAQAGVDQVVFRQVAETVKKARNNFETSRLLDDNSWNSIQEQTFRKVRKILRSALNALQLDGQKGKLGNPESAKIMKDMTQMSESQANEIIEKLKARSSVQGITLEQAIHTVRLCLLWFRTRNEYQKAFVLNRKQMEEMADMPPVRLEAFKKSLGDNLITEEKLEACRSELEMVNTQLESHDGSTLSLWQ